MTTDLSGASGARCAVHPARRAVDRCPVCERHRCAADAGAAPAGGCLACGGTAEAGTPAGRGASDLERAVRAALAASGVALLGGVVAAQYVGAEVFAYLTPFVVGVLVAAAAQSAAGAGRTGPLGARLRPVASAYAVVGVALGFALERSEGVLAPRSLLAYAAAVAGVLLWLLPPKRPAADRSLQRRT